MKVTVAILTYNEEENIPVILGSLEKQDFPAGDYEVLIVDNGSTDGTIEAVNKFQGGFESLRVVVNEVKGIAQSRNVALRDAAHELIAFTDADVIVPENWLSTLVAGFSDCRKTDQRTVAVGGGNVPPEKGDRFQQALGVTLNSFWGSHGSTQGMLLKDITAVPHIPTLNILYDKQAVIDAGGFDEDFRMVCEDPELNHRLTKAGRTIYFLPGATVIHKMRPTLWEWLKNVFLYGRGRTQIIRKHPDHFSPMYLIPPLIVIALALTPLSLLHWKFLLPLTYFAVPGIIASLLVQKAGKPEAFEPAYMILAFNPIAYGLGMLYALIVKKT